MNKMRKRGDWIAIKFAPESIRFVEVADFHNRVEAEQFADSAGIAYFVWRRCDFEDWYDSEIASHYMASNES